MERGAWKKPVLLEMYGRPGTIQVCDTLEAALLLLGGWHSRRTDAHTTAVLTCREVLKGRAQPGLARAVFIDAILDAGYHILPETFLDGRWGPAPVIDERQDKADAPLEAVPIIRHRTQERVSARKPIPRHDLRHQADRSIADLLAQLGETLVLIAIEIARNAASLLNIEVRPRPDKQMR